MVHGTVCIYKRKNLLSIAHEIAKKKNLKKVSKC
jgi:hypothetical protein